MTTKRTAAREAALQLLFTHDLNDGIVREDVLRHLREQLPDADARDFALKPLRRHARPPGGHRHAHQQPPPRTGGSSASPSSTATPSAWVPTN